MNPSPLILICDDDPVVHESLKIYMEAEHFEVISAMDGTTGLNLALDRTPDLMILDLMMPGMSGTEVCREIRRHTDMPIIMLTARGEELDRVLGLELGADDYIVKPFSPREVVARIKAVLRRITERTEVRPQHLTFDGLEVNLNNYQVKIHGQTVPFTPKEVEVLYYLASHPGQVMERGQIIHEVWGFDYFGDTRTIDTHIKRIRQKISVDGARWDIGTVYGVGYRFEVLP